MPRLIPCLLGALLATAPALAAGDFPLREKYAEVEWMSTRALYDSRERVILVDSRGEIQNAVMHIPGARNLPLSGMKMGDLLHLREKDGGTPLVFYCNDENCSLSYLAVEKARSWGFENVFAYDAGLSAWLEAHADRVSFFGEVLSASELKAKLISNREFSAVCLDPGAFKAKASGGYPLFDIRDRQEQGEEPMRLPGTKTVSVDEMVEILAHPGELPSRRFLILDELGKQVRWIQYYLERQGIDDYYFLKGGASHWRATGLGPDGRPLVQRGS